MTAISSNAPLSGSRSMQVIRGSRGVDDLFPTWPSVEAPGAIRRFALPHRSECDEVNAYRSRNATNIWRGFRRVKLAKALHLPHMHGSLFAKVIRGDGQVLDLGLISMRVVTDAGVGFIVDAFQNLTELENMKYHGFGTGGAAEAVGNTALTTELTTQYASDNTRPTGTTIEGASANIYRTVATLAPDSGGTIAITEHGVFSQAATGGGVLLDRSLFAAVNLVAGSDSLQVTYDLTFTSGS